MFDNLPSHLSPVRKYDQRITSSPAVADVDSDGQQEIIIGSWDSSVYCLTGIATNYIPPSEGGDSDTQFGGQYYQGSDKSGLHLALAIVPASVCTIVVFFAVAKRRADF